jgi:hypothetical protein
MRYLCPPDTTGITLSSGPYSADASGAIDLPDELAAGDLAGLSANGFTPAPIVHPTSKASGLSPASESLTTKE